MTQPPLPLAETALATTMNDPQGLLAAHIAANADLLGQYASLHINATRITAESTLEALRAGGAEVETHEPDATTIGLSRRRAVEAALSWPARYVLYTDFDMAVSWVVPERVATLPSPTGMTVVGRNAEDRAQMPARLRTTEDVVNHLFRLASGNEWDVLGATRVFTRDAAAAIVGCEEPSIGNDVVWPMFLLASGTPVSYAEVGGYRYIARDDFGRGNDTRDAQAIEWIRRIEIAAVHATALRPYIDARQEPTSETTE